MNLIHEWIQFIGIQSMYYLWFPILIWTILCSLILIIIRAIPSLNPLNQYRLRVATILALPIGCAIKFGLSILDYSIIDFTESSSYTKIFVLVNPLEINVSTNSKIGNVAYNFLDPYFLLGLATCAITLISSFFIIRLIFDYMNINKLYNHFEFKSANDFNSYTPAKLDRIKIAFSQQTIVPFTFGWKNPVIVLPKSIQDDPKKIQMALQHELIHIKRNDYIIQLSLSFVSAIFWFHPIIGFVNEQIEIFREISCDHEVLNTSGISLTDYAAMLYELIPLNWGFRSMLVNMAGHKSTLKHRISAMKNYKSYKYSKSYNNFFFLLIMIGILIPITCTNIKEEDDLNLQDIEYELVNPSIEIDGVQQFEILGVTKKLPLSYGFSITSENHGTFIFSGTHFEGATKTGFMHKNNITFKWGKLDIKLKNAIDFGQDISTNVWVDYLPELRQKGSSLNVFEPNDMQKVSFKTAFKSQFTFSDDDSVYNYVDNMPELFDDLSSIQSKIIYTELARKNKIQGRVTISFIVNKSGDVENPTIVKSLDPGLDEMALNAIKGIKFTPGIKDGNPVKVKMAIPIVFKLSD